MSAPCIGLLGGSFDPPHKGHRTIAQDARDQLHLDQVYLIPALQSPLRSTQHCTSFDHRVAMCRALAAACHWLDVLDVEGHLPQPSYTLHTIDFLQHQNPGHRFVWIIGADQLLRLPEWYRIGELVHKVEFAVASRPGSRLEVPAIPGLRVHPLLPRLMDISSSRIREKLSVGERIDDSVTGEVIDYIRAHELYRTFTA